MRCRSGFDTPRPWRPARPRVPRAHTFQKFLCLVCLAATWTPRAIAQSPDPDLDLAARPRSSVELPTVKLNRTDDPVSTLEHPVRIERRTYRVQAVDRRGLPISGLGTRDFEVVLGAEPVKVESLRWVQPSAPVTDESHVHPGTAPSRYLLFVQAGREPFFGRSHMRLQRQIREFLGGLELGAAVCVVSYDAKLKLWLDFTRDRELVERVVAVAGRFTAEPSEQPAQEEDLPSLRTIWDPDLARDIDSAEQGLNAMARYLGELPGMHTMIYVGWGLGRYSRPGAPEHQFRQAAESLADAGVQVFVLGAVESELNLGNGLLELADATGGDYFHSRHLAAARMRELAASLSAYYLVTLDAEDLVYAVNHDPKRDPSRDIEIRLRFRDGRVYGPPRPVE